MKSGKVREMAMMKRSYNAFMVILRAIITSKNLSVAYFNVARVWHLLQVDPWQVGLVPATLQRDYGMFQHVLRVYTIKGVIFK